MSIFGKADLSFKYSVELLLSNMLAFIDSMKEFLLKMLQKYLLALILA